MSLINKVYTAQDMRNAAKCLFACEVDLEHDNRDIAKTLRQAAGMMDRADRDAAAKREREATREYSSQVGNASAMREALESVRNWCLNRLFNSPHQVTVEGLLSVVNAALSAPPRNCDVGTPEEQSARFDAHCRKHMGCLTCPLREKDGGVPKHCELAWAKMPYVG